MTNIIHNKVIFFTPDIYFSTSDYVEQLIKTYPSSVLAGIQFNTNNAQHERIYFQKTSVNWFLFEEVIGE